MATQPYRLKDGTRVPGVTTILGRFKEAGGLIHWSNRLAYDPLMQVYHLAKENPAAVAGWAKEQNPDLWDYRYVRDHAADAGSCAHELFDAHIRKDEAAFEAAQKKYAPQVLETASPAYSAALEWAMQSKLEIVESEKPLVSEVLRFGGTRDAILVGGKRALGDWKTSKDIYPEYLVQLAAYAILDEEHGQTIDGGFHLLQFSKQEKPDDPVRFTHRYWSHLDKCREAFLHLRLLYDLMSDIAKIAK